MTIASRPPRWLQAIRSALFNLAMYAATVVCCILFLPLLLGPMRWAQLAGVMRRNMSVRLEAMVTSETGKVSSPFSAFTCFGTPNAQRRPMIR